MFEKVEEFEKVIADFYGAPSAVATDCCTHAIELSLRHLKTTSVVIPRHTYVSIPLTAIKLGINWKWSDNTWRNFYYLKGTPVIDAAVHWQKNSYVPNTFMCLSFQFRKHLSLGRGGAILCEADDYISLKKMSYDGRLPNIPWAEQNIDTMGYHYYMTPETAQQGIEKLPTAKVTKPKLWSWQDYPDLSKNKVFN